MGSGDGGIDDVAIGRFQHVADGIGYRRKQDCLRRYVCLVQPEGDTVFLSGSDEAFRVEHDLVIRHSGEDLLVVLREAVGGVRRQVTRHLHVAVVAIAQSLECSGIQDFSTPEPDGEDAPIERGDEVGDVGDIAARVRSVILFTVGEHYHRLHVVASDGIEDAVGEGDPLTDRGPAVRIG